MTSDGTDARDKELSLIEHLAELKSRLVVSAIAVAITTTISFLFATPIIKILLLPSGQRKLVSFSPTENFSTIFHVALMSGIALAMPVLLYEVYAYIDPALHKHERRFLLTMGPFVLLLFVSGMLFCYFFLLPPAIDFLIHFGDEVIENQLRASEYLSFVTTYILALGLVFEMPAIIYALIRVGVVKRAVLTRARRYVFLACFIIGAVITPTPDPFNQTLVSLPMYFLFELGLLLGRFGVPRSAT